MSVSNGRKKKRAGMSKAEALRVQQRTDELVMIRLDGAQWWDVVQYVSEKSKEAGSCWEVKQGGKHLSERQLRRYIARADRIIIASVKEKRTRSIRRHLAQRANLYAKAVNAGDVRTALAVADSEAKLRGLFDTPAHPARLEPIKAPEDVVPLVASTIADLRAGRLDNKTATSIGGLAGTLLRSIEVTELEERLTALEAAAEARQASTGRNGRGY